MFGATVALPEARGMNRIEKDGNKPKLRLTLVHGTFAGQAGWVRDGESEEGFRRRLLVELRRALGDRFGRYELCFEDRFTWGAPGWKRFWKDNTMQARLNGADELAGWLKRLPDTAGDRHYLVAHSHGGNVAMYALRDPEARGRVDGLACLAVPFLYPEVTPFKRDVLLFSAAVIVLMALDLASVWLWAYAILYGALTAWILSSGNLGDSEKSLARILARKNELTLPGELPAADGSQMPVLVLTVPGDEVSWLMRVARWVGRHFRLAWEVLNRFGLWIVGSLLVFSLVRFAAAKLGLELGRAERVALWVDQTLATPLLIVASVVLLVIAVMRWCFAFDGARWIAGIDIRTEAGPPAPHRPEAVAKVPVGGVLRHTDIQQRAVRQIAEWVAKTA